MTLSNCYLILNLLIINIVPFSKPPFTQIQLNFPNNSKKRNCDSLKIGFDPGLAKSLEKLLSRRCALPPTRACKLRYPFQPRNWSNGIHLFNRANSIGATPERESRKGRVEELCKMCRVAEKQFPLLFSPFALSPFERGRDGSPVYAFRRRKLPQKERNTKDGGIQAKLGWLWNYQTAKKIIQ